MNAFVLGLLIKTAEEQSLREKLNLPPTAPLENVSQYPTRFMGKTSIYSGLKATYDAVQRRLNNTKTPYPTDFETHLTNAKRFIDNALQNKTADPEILAHLRVDLGKANLNRRIPTYFHNHTLDKRNTPNYFEYGTYKPTASIPTRRLFDNARFDFWEQAHDAVRGHEFFHALVDTSPFKSKLESIPSYLRDNNPKATTNSYPREEILATLRGMRPESAGTIDYTDPKATTQLLRDILFRKLKQSHPLYRYSNPTTTPYYLRNLFNLEDKDKERFIQEFGPLLPAMVQTKHRRTDNIV